MTLLKQGSLLEKEKTNGKKERKSIHERLKINKGIIAKQQGKDSKGVELAWLLREYSKAKVEICKFRIV